MATATSSPELTEITSCLPPLNRHDDIYDGKPVTKTEIPDSDACTPSSSPVPAHVEETNPSLQELKSSPESLTVEFSDRNFVEAQSTVHGIRDEVHEVSSHGSIEKEQEFHHAEEPDTDVEEVTPDAREDVVSSGNDELPRNSVDLSKISDLATSHEGESQIEGDVQQVHQVEEFHTTAEPETTNLRTLSTPDIGGNISAPMTHELDIKQTRTASLVFQQPTDSAASTLSTRPLDIVTVESPTSTIVATAEAISSSDLPNTLGHPSTGRSTDEDITMTDPMPTYDDDIQPKESKVTANGLSPNVNKVKISPEDLKTKETRYIADSNEEELVDVPNTQIHEEHLSLLANARSKTTDSKSPVSERLHNPETRRSRSKDICNDDQSASNQDVTNVEAITLAPEPLKEISPSTTSTIALPPAASIQPFVMVSPTKRKSPNPSFRAPSPIKRGEDLIASTTPPFPSPDIVSTLLNTKNDNLVPSSLPTPESRVQSKDIAMAELKAIKMASIQARITALQEQIAAKKAKRDETQKYLKHPAAETVKRHIKLLHDYNDIKDIGQGLMGMIADQRGVRVGELYEEFGVNLKD